MIRIAVVDGHPVVRAGLRGYLREDPDLSVVAETSTGAQAVEIVRRGEIDLVILDLSLPSQSGLEVLSLIRARAPRLPVLVFSGFSAALYAETAMRLGADAYLHKGCDPIELVQTVKRLCNGWTRQVSKPEAAVDGDSTAPAAGDVTPHRLLNAREFQILLRLAKGESVGSIGQSLHLATATVSVYRSRLVRKLNLKSNAELTRYAVLHGLF